MKIYEKDIENNIVSKYCTIYKKFKLISQTSSNKDHIYSYLKQEYSTFNNAFPLIIHLMVDANIYNVKAFRKTLKVLPRYKYFSKPPEEKLKIIGNVYYMRAVVKYRKQHGLEKERQYINYVINEWIKKMKNTKKQVEERDNPKKEEVPKVKPHKQIQYGPNLPKEKQKEHMKESVKKYNKNKK